MQPNLHGHRGREDDPLDRDRRALHTGRNLPTEKQKDRFQTIFAADEHAEVEVTWWIYQRMITFYCHPDRAKGRDLMVKLTDTLRPERPAVLSEFVTLNGTQKKRADVLADFDRPDTTNGPTEAFNGRLVNLRGSETSPTTSPDRSSRPAVSDPNKSRIVSARLPRAIPASDSTPLLE